ncbi:hypothetical protein MBCUT_17520 [Methanobrevibacter cuticularis]|uniref:Uncharacterized protein n=1 Tax=Methanobrevibacter cuticularis TaxID=47311 RepID=A0A166D0A5_9EURY|nr:hypothetical protein [Methanobrevibacter cuticularis]KZX15064.1 hypothetical protein MBCUT_17520 [Methanobrevibacter cuticularis]
MISRHKTIITIFLILLLSIAGTYFFLNSYKTEEIGSQSIGYVTKDTYSYFSNPSAKIAIISGMHSREKISKDVLPLVSKEYALWNNVEIVNYKVVVTVDAEKFLEGRQNGEKLVHDYVVQDINASDFDLVIIGHDHEQGYGEGFYIATPSMDNKSIALAEVVRELPDFNHYKRELTKEAQSSSITVVDDPIVATGTPLFVYEIPEWLGLDEAFKQSYDLLQASFNFIQK